MQIAGIDMVIGQKYTLTMCVREGGNRGVTQIRKRMRLVGLYPHHAQFEQRGVRTSFGYWQLEKMLKGEIYE